MEELRAELTVNPGAQARPGRAGSALGDLVTKSKSAVFPPLFIQQQTAGPLQLKYDFKHVKKPNKIMLYKKTIFAYWNIFSPELPISLEII